MTTSHDRMQQFRLKYPGVITDGCLLEEYYSILRNDVYLPSDYCNQVREAYRWVKGGYQPGK